MQKIKVAILKGRRELEGSSGVDYFTLNLCQELKKHSDIEPTLIYGNYILPGIFKFLHFNNLDNFDIIHNCVPGLGIFIRTKKPIITTFYDDIMFNPKFILQNVPFIKRHQSLLLKKIWSIGLSFDIYRSNKIVSISDQAKEALERRLKIKSEMIKVIPPGIRTDIFYPRYNIQKKRKKNSSRLFYCGRLCFRKGIDLLLDSLVILKFKKKVPNLKLYLAGALDENYKLYNEIERRKLQSIVHYLGSISDEEIATNYNLCDVFVFPSRIEGYGIPPLEALACGVKVVSTHVPSVEPFSEIIKVEANAKDIARGILDAKEKKINLEKEILKIKKEFTYSNIANSYIMVYKQVIKNYEK